MPDFVTDARRLGLLRPATTLRRRLKQLRQEAEVRNAYGAQHAKDVLSDPRNEPQWFEHVAELPPRLRQLVADAPGLRVYEDNACPANPDLWSEEYEHELKTGLHSHVTLQALITPQAMCPREEEGHFFTHRSLLQLRRERIAAWAKRRG